MKANPYISIKEKRMLTIIATLIFSLTLLNLSSIVIEDYNNLVKEKQEKLLHEANGTGGKLDFTLYCMCRASYVPPFRFFAIFLFPFVLKAKKFIFPTLLTFLSFCLFVYENLLSFRAYYANETHPPFFEFVGYIARPLDYLVFPLISILLFWQISILLRMLIKSLQRKNELP